MQLLYHLLYRLPLSVYSGHWRMAQPVKPSLLNPNASLDDLHSFHHFCPDYFHLKEETVVVVVAAAQVVGEQWLEEALVEVYLLLSVNNHQKQYGQLNISLLSFM